jgi:hypothetical protein
MREGGPVLTAEPGYDQGFNPFSQLTLMLLAHQVVLPREK